MDFLKALFESGALTWEQFVAAVGAKGYKLADLSTGNYVAKKKYEDDIASRDTQIGDLTGQIATRDTDLKTLKKQLEDGTKDSDTKITTLTEQLNKLQGDYKTVKSDYETKLQNQAYEFAVKEFANGQNFSSRAAKATFIKDMVDAKLQMNKDAIIGASDFLEAYKKDYADSFVTKKETEPEPTPNPDKPTFVAPPAQGNPGGENPFDSFFNFAGVR